jgi:hypothetical protein
MKKLFAFIFVACMSVSVQAEPEKCQNCQKQDEITNQVVISNFANMIMSIIQMAANPYDPQTLAAGGCNIVSGIANIAQQAAKLVQQGEISEDQVAAHFYAKMIELGLHEQIAQQVSRSALRTMIADAR